MYKNATGGRGFGGTARFSGGRLVATTPRMARALKSAEVKADRESQQSKPVQKKQPVIPSKVVKPGGAKKRVKRDPTKFETALAAAIGKKAAAAYIRTQQNKEKKKSR